MNQNLFQNLFLDFIYLFFERGSEGEREGEKRLCVVAFHIPLTLTGDPARNPGMCPRLGVEPATLWFTGQLSIRRATPARKILSDQKTF